MIVFRDKYTETKYNEIFASSLQAQFDYIRVSNGASAEVMTALVKAKGAKPFLEYHQRMSQPGVLYILYASTVDEDVETGQIKEFAFNKFYMRSEGTVPVYDNLEAIVSRQAPADVCGGFINHGSADRPGWSMHT